MIHFKPHSNTCTQLSESRFPKFTLLNINSTCIVSYPWNIENRGRPGHEANYYNTNSIINIIYGNFFVSVLILYLHDIVHVHVHVHYLVYMYTVVVYVYVYTWSCRWFLWLQTWFFPRYYMEYFYVTSNLQYYATFWYSISGLIQRWLTKAYPVRCYSLGAWISWKFKATRSMYRYTYKMGSPILHAHVYVYCFVIKICFQLKLISLHTSTDNSPLWILRIYSNSP